MRHVALLLICMVAACASGPSRPPQPAGEPTVRQPAVTSSATERTASVREVTPVLNRRADAPPAQLAGESAALETVVLARAHGEATYYADKFDGRRTASGSVFRNTHMVAAHRNYPFGTVVRVTNLKNDRSVIVRVVDRGPHGTSARAQRTIIDLSQRAARALDFLRAGRVPVQVDVLEWGGRATNRSLSSGRPPN